MSQEQLSQKLHWLRLTEYAAAQYHYVAGYWVVAGIQHMIQRRG